MTLQFIVWIAVIGAVIFWPAGTLAYPGGWAFLALFTLGGIVMTAWLARHDPHLLKERMSSPLQRAQKPWDRAFMLLFIVGFFGWLAFMGWDAARTGFTAMPAWLQALGGGVMVLYMIGAWWTFRENSFAAPVVKIQEGQHVIDSGPYAFVRHPMYTSALLLFVSMPLLLGSWRGLIGAAIFTLGIAWRAVHEERTLRAELAGYDAYAARVRARLIPRVW